MVYFSTEFCYCAIVLIKYFVSIIKQYTQYTRPDEHKNKAKPPKNRLNAVVKT